MKPLPGENYMVCDYKYFLRIPNNYHLDYDGHYYSVLYTYCGQPAILKATLTEIRICDGNNRLLCRHRRSYKEFPLYITDDSHMRPEHLYYKEVNAKNGAYYRRWASVYGRYMSELVGTSLNLPGMRNRPTTAAAVSSSHVKTSHMALWMRQPVNVWKCMPANTLTLRKSLVPWPTTINPEAAGNLLPFRAMKISGERTFISRVAADEEQSGINNGADAGM